MLIVFSSSVSYVLLKNYLELFLKRFAILFDAYTLNWSVFYLKNIVKAQNMSIT